MSGQTTRTMLIRAMLKLVRAKRFSSITINEICERAQVSRRTFYRYYSDKQALLKDVFLECFYSKIDVEACENPWDLIQAICEQIYSDKYFFIHSFEVKGQNGFWEEFSLVLMPFFQKGLQSNESSDSMKEFFAATDIDRLLQLIENWIRTGMPSTPEEFASSLRTAYYIYATWITELATGKSISEFPDVVLDTIKKVR